MLLYFFQLKRNINGSRLSNDLLLIPPDKGISWTIKGSCGIIIFGPRASDQILRLVDCFLGKLLVSFLTLRIHGL